MDIDCVQLQRIQMGEPEFVRAGSNCGIDLCVCISDNWKWVKAFGWKPKAFCVVVGMFGLWKVGNRGKGHMYIIIYVINMTGEWVRRAFGWKPKGFWSVVRMFGRPSVKRVLHLLGIYLREMLKPLTLAWGGFWQRQGKGRHRDSYTQTQRVREDTGNLCIEILSSSFTRNL